MVHQLHNVCAQKSELAYQEHLQIVKIHLINIL